MIAEDKFPGQKSPKAESGDDDHEKPGILRPLDHVLDRLGIADLKLSHF